MRNIFEDIFAIFSLLKTLFYYGLHYSITVGKFLAQFLNTLITTVLLFIKSLKDISVIIFEGLKYFCEDIFECTYSLILFLGQISDGILTTVSAVFLNVCSFLQVIKNFICEIFNHLQNSVFNLGACILTLCKFCKHVIVLFGSGVWFLVTLLPYSLYDLLLLIFHILNSIPKFLNDLVQNIGNCIKNCVIEIYKFVTDIAIESVIGLLIGICFIYLLTQFYLTIYTFLYCKIRIIVRNIRPRRYRYQRPRRNDYVINRLKNALRYVLNWFRRLLQRERNFNRSLLNVPTTSRRPIHSNEEVKNLSNERLCVICQDRIKCILILPCRHLCLCNECHRRLLYYNNNCPICRNNIERTMEIFV